MPPTSASSVLDDNEVPEPEVAAVGSCEADDEDSIFALATMAGDEPSAREALSGPECNEWKASMQAEIDQLVKMGTWEGPVERPAGANVVRSHWVLKRKRDEQNIVTKLKSRLVAGGNTQVYGLDYNETSSPTIRLSSLRFILALAAQNDWNFEVIDFANAYLNGDLDEVIYMRQPPGFEVPGKENQVLRLKKALYGLKQAGRQWYQKVYELLVNDLGFSRSENDPAVFYLFENGSTLIVGVHVDDCAVVTNCSTSMNAFKASIRARYKIVESGSHGMIGIAIRRDLEARTISLSQSGYIDVIAARFNLANAKPLTVPMDPHTNLFVTVTEDDRVAMKNKPYAQLVGSLMYAAVATRPDIAYAVSTLARFMSNPAVVHWEAAKRVLRYMIGTKHYALTLGLTDDGLIGFTDADWASQAHRHSITGWVFTYNGGAISWSSRKQSVIALSSTEAEYVAGSSATRELIWLCRLVSELTASTPTTIPLNSDNQGAIALAKSGLLNARTKHIDIHYHFTCDAAAKGQANIVYCPTNEMAADILTKALPHAKVEYFCWLLGLRTV
jgi:hypothetical protein